MVGVEGHRCVWRQGAVRLYPHLGWKWGNPRSGTHCHRLHCPHHCLEWGLEFLDKDTSIRLVHAQALYPLGLDELTLAA